MHTAPMSDTVRQLFRFVVVGVAATITDFGLYLALLSTVLPGLYDVAKGIGFLAGTTVSFIANKYWTFESTESDSRELGAFVVLYATTLVMNVATNRGMLMVGAELGLAEEVRVPLAFVSAVCVSMVGNFIGQKFWVFADRE